MSRQPYHHGKQISEIITLNKDQNAHKSKTKKKNEKGHSVTVVVGDSIVKKVKG